MSAIKKFKQRTITIHVVTALAIMSATAHAEQAVDLGQVSTTGAYSGKVDKDSASYNAPSQTNLEATQPQSIINQHWIEENSMAGANYSDIISIVPSVVEMSPNGPGLMESGGGANSTPTIRGFQDGQYNVTFDGIPWADSNDFTHHSTVYFMPQDMGQVIVDRGPGDASTIGNATYGGTIAVSSKAPSNKQETNVFGTFGSWNTRLIGSQYDSGLNNDTRFYFSMKNLNSDGFLTNSPQSRNNAFLKYEKILSDSTTVTAVAMYNHTMQHVPYGATPQQLAQYGYNFGLTNNGQSESNSAYNYDDLTTDFEYIGIKSNFGHWKLDNKLYTYAYYHDGFSGANAGSVSLSDTQNDGGANGILSHVPGAKMHNNNRSVGDLLRASYEFGHDRVETGFWFDRQTDNRFEQQIDWTTSSANQIASISAANNPATQGSIDRNMQNSLNTVQTYLQYVWKITPDWEVTPGLKYDSFTRVMDATVNQKSSASLTPYLPYSGSYTWDKVVKSLNTHYAVNNNLSAYAQYSEGFLAPNMNVFYTTAVNLGSITPTTTKNYQIGTNWKSQAATFGFAIYRVDANSIATATSSCTVSNCSYQIQPQARYSGFELEGTYNLVKGLAIYGNFSRNNYYNPSGSVLQNSPNTTAALGLIHQNGNLYASLMSKYIGSFFSNVDANGNNLYLDGYTLTNFDLSYKIDGKYKVGMAINNILNKTGYMGSMYQTAGSNPLYYVIPTRSYQVNFSVPF